MKWFVLLFVCCSTPSFSQISDSVIIDLRDDKRNTLLLMRSDDSTATLQVVDRDGYFVTGLKPTDFVVARSGHKPASLTLDTVLMTDSAAIRIAFVLDNSESMFDAFDSLTIILDTFISKFGAGFSGGITLFDTDFRTADHYSTKRDRVFVAQRAFTQSKDSLSLYWHSYDSIRSRFTPLYDALGHALNALKDDPDFTRTDVVIAVSDGSDNGSITSLESLRRLFTRTGIRLFTVNYRTPVDRKLVYLGRETRGAHFSAEYLGELRTVLGTLAKKLSPVYRLRYTFPAVKRRSNTLRSGQ